MRHPVDDEIDSGSHDCVAATVGLCAKKSSFHRQAVRHDRLMVIHTWLPANCSETKGVSHPSICSTGPSNGVSFISGCGTERLASGGRGRLLVAKSGPSFARAGVVTNAPHLIRKDLRPSICLLPQPRRLNRTPGNPLIPADVRCDVHSQWRKPEGRGASPLLACVHDQFRCEVGFASGERSRIRLLESPQRWTIRDVESRQFKALAGIVAAAGIELRTVVGKREQVFSKKTSKPDRAACICASASANLPARVTSRRRDAKILQGRRLQSPEISTASASSVRPHRWINLRQMHARFHIAAADTRWPFGTTAQPGSIAAPVRSSPQRTPELKANPRHGERRDILVLPQRLAIGPFGLVEFAQIGEQRAQRHQFLQMPGLGGAFAAGRKRPRQVLFRVA